MAVEDIGTTKRLVTHSGRGGQPQDFTGTRFGRWTAKYLSDERKARRTMWFCACDCGTERLVLTCHLVSGKSVSCGCYKDEVGSARAWKHGHGGKNNGSGMASEYRIWSLMKGRCSNPNLPEYKSYGGRGIQVCDRWKSDFRNFLDDMGPRPSRRHSIDRINNNANYEPGNCRWATQKEQANNTRRNVVVVVAGRQMTMTQAVERYSSGRSYKAVLERYRKGEGIEHALGLR
jgi:hypothetical protein